MCIMVVCVFHFRAPNVQPLSVSSSTYEPINGTVVQLSPMQIRTFNITFG